MENKTLDTEKLLRALRQGGYALNKMRRGQTLTEDDLNQIERNLRLALEELELFAGVQQKEDWHSYPKTDYAPVAPSTNSVPWPFPTRGPEAATAPAPAVPAATTSVDFVQVGDYVIDSPVGAGFVTSISDAGWPRVDHVAVTWLKYADGRTYDPLRKSNTVGT